MSRARRTPWIAVLLVALAALAAPGLAAAAENYVALGDSYSSGVGTNSYTLSSSCKRSTYAYPALWSAAHPGTALSFVACSGATTATVLNGTSTLPPQVNSLAATTTLVTITVGGNDLGFASLIQRCVTSDCNAALTSTRTSAAATLNAKLDAVYTAIKARAPSARVVVLGYPRLFSTASCFGTSGITSSERANANLLSEEIDRVIGARAGASGFAYRSALGSFTGHAVCSSTAWLNGLNIFNTTESFHPNRTGQSSGYRAILTAFTG